MKNIILVIAVIVLATLPEVASAQYTQTMQLITGAGYIVDALTVLAVGIALLAFFWGLAKFIFRASGDENAVDEGKRLMIWGVVALFVIISIWGLISFLQSELIPGTPISPLPIPRIN